MELHGRACQAIGPDLKQQIENHSKGNKQWVNDNLAINPPNPPIWVMTNHPPRKYSINGKQLNGYFHSNS